MSKTVYYFSATGNSLQAALDIAEGLGGAEVVSITKAGMGAKCDSDVIGFVFPTFCWGLPNMVQEFIGSGDFNKDAYFFTVVTCGSAIGGSAYNVDSLLKGKGAKLSYGVKLESVSNYIPLYDIKVATIDEVLAKSDHKLAGIIDDLKERKSCSIKREFWLVRIFRKRLMAGYKTVDKDYIVDESCDGCNICASVCPARNIELAEGRPTFKHNCEHCIACIHWCPQRAINYKKKTQKRHRYHHPKVKAEQLP